MSDNNDKPKITKKISKMKAVVKKINGRPMVVIVNRENPPKSKK